MYFVFNRNTLLFLSSLVMMVYALTLNNSLLGMVAVFVTYSAIYEVFIKYYIGVWFEIKPREYSWCIHKEKNKK